MKKKSDKKNWDKRQKRKKKSKGNGDKRLYSTHSSSGPLYTLL